MTFDPDQFFRLTALAVFAVSAVDVGIAFLIRALRSSTPDGPHD